jgi:hypothetical protein
MIKALIRCILKNIHDLKEVGSIGGRGEEGLSIVSKLY